MAFSARSAAWTALCGAMALLGVPAARADSYDPGTGLLTIDYVQVGSRVYSHVVVRVEVKNVVSVAGDFAQPTGTVQHGGLTWSQPSMTAYTYADAVAYCSGTAPNNVGSPGWRLPTIEELTGIAHPGPGAASATGGVYASGALTAQGWPSSGLVWSSTPTAPGDPDNYPGYWGVFLARNVDARYPFPAGSIANSAPADWAYVSCVRQAEANGARRAEVPGPAASPR